MFFIFGTYSQKLEENQTKKFMRVKFRRWMSFFFVPLIPCTHKYIYFDLNTKKKYEVVIPILPVALVLNFLFFTGILITFGLIYWLLYLGIWFTLLLATSQQPQLLQYSSLALLIIAEFFTFQEFQKRQRLYEEYQTIFERSN